MILTDAGMSRILVFDIDGTLTQTNRVDGECFRAAVQTVFPEVRVGSFRGFTEFTDSAILAEICAVNTDRDYTSVQSDVQGHFFSGLRAAARQAPHAFRSVPGARGIFEHVRGAGWIPAMATGGWRESAELKLALAQIPTLGVPLATSSDHVRRVDIIRRAVTQAASGAAVGEVIYVGDGTWDIRACRELGIGFIGRATPDSEAGLMEQGAKAILPDFSDAATLIDLLGDPRSLQP